MSDADDDLARLRAMADQARAALGDAAQNLWAFYSESLRAGFSDEQAFVLTLTLLQSLMGGES